MASPMMADFGDHTYINKIYFAAQSLREAKMFTWILIYLPNLGDKRVRKT